MKRFLMIACLLGLLSPAVSAQKLKVGDRAPELRIKEWLAGAPKQDNKPRFVEFFYSRSEPSLKRLPDLDKTAQEYDGRLNVIVVCREDLVTAAKAIGGQRKFFAGVDDDNRTFAAYGVQYVPFAVIIDSRGRISWFGNPETLSGKDLSEFLK